MRILVLTNLYPPEGYGGYELTCRDIAERFARRGHEVLVVTSDYRAPDGVRDNAARAAVSVDRLLPMTWERGERRSRVVVTVQSVGADRAFRRVVSTFRPDVVSVWNPTGLPGTIVGRLPSLGSPVVWVFADAWPARFLEGDPWLAALATRPMLGRAIRTFTRLPTALPDPSANSTACFCSADLRRRVAASTGWNLDGGVIAPLGIDPDDFPAGDRRDLARWDWRLLYVGRLDAGKGVDTVVRALPALGQATLTIVGPPEPEHMTRLRELVARVGVDSRVRFTSLPRHRLAAVYRDADVCVFPSEWAEPFGIVPLEAMACGTPVVATGVGGSGEYLVDGGNCVQFSPGDPDSLVAAVQSLASDPELRRRLVDAGTRTAGSLTVDRLADQLESLYERVTGAASGTSPTPSP